MSEAATHANTHEVLLLVRQSGIEIRRQRFR